MHIKNMMQHLYTNYDKFIIAAHIGVVCITIINLIPTVHEDYLLCIMLYCLVAPFAAFNTSFDGSHFTQESVLASLAISSMLVFR